MGTSTRRSENRKPWGYPESAQLKRRRSTPLNDPRSDHRQRSDMDRSVRCDLWFGHDSDLASVVGVRDPLHCHCDLATLCHPAGLAGCDQRALTRDNGESRRDRILARYSGEGGDDWTDYRNRQFGHHPV